MAGGFDRRDVDLSHLHHRLECALGGCRVGVGDGGRERTRCRSYSIITIQKLYSCELLTSFKRINFNLNGHISDKERELNHFN